MTKPSEGVPIPTFIKDEPYELEDVRKMLPFAREDDAIDGQKRFYHPGLVDYFTKRPDGKLVYTGRYPDGVEKSKKAA